MLWQPHTFQQDIVQHILEHPRCKIWAGMGLGKTSAVLTALNTLAALGRDESPALVLGPLRVARDVWPAEARKWQHLKRLRIVPVIGTVAERTAALRQDADVYTSNYDTLPWLTAHLAGKWPFKTVVADESTRLKSFRLRQGGTRARALGGIAHTQIKRFINLTGTPCPNGLIDLWGQTWFLDIGVRLGRTHGAFKERWFRPNYNGFGVSPLPTAQAEIQAKLHDLTITVDAKDYFDLEDPIVRNIYVDLPPKARKFYRDMEDEMFAEIEEHPIEVFNTAARTQKLLQMANGAVYRGSADDPGPRLWVTTHDAKIEALASIYEEAAGAPLLVAYEFRSDLSRIMKAFPAARLLTEPNAIADWGKGRISMLLAHPKSAGHGLNLQDGGNILVYFGHNWDLEMRIQILERIGPVRQKQSGHDRPVFVYNLIARDTMDEDVIERCGTKRSVQDTLLAAMKRRRG